MQTSHGLQLDLHLHSPCAERVADGLGLTRHSPNITLPRMWANGWQPIESELQDARGTQSQTRNRQLDRRVLSIPVNGPWDSPSNAAVYGGLDPSDGYMLSVSGCG